MFGFKWVDVKAEEKKLSDFEQMEQDKKDLTRENESLREDRSKLKEEVADLGLEAKIADEDIKHMVKMSEERQEIELEKKIMANDRAKDEAIAEVKDKYRDKMETQLSKETENIKEMYGQILERLPNVNAKLTGSLDN